MWGYGWWLGPSQDFQRGWFTPWGTQTVATAWLRLGSPFDVLNWDLGLSVAGGLELGGHTRCFALEVPICSSQFASSASGQEGVWGLLGGHHHETLLCKQSRGPPPGPRLSLEHTRPGPAVLRDTAGRWPVSGEGGSWHNKSRTRLGGGQGSLTGLLSAWRLPITSRQGLINRYHGIIRRRLRHQL